MNNVRFWSHWAWRVYRLARTRQDKLSVARFIVLRGLSRYVKQQDTTVQLNGARYRIGIRTGEINTLLELYDDRAYDYIQDFVPDNGWIVFDVGANVGMFTVRQARRGAKVYAFEPNPGAYKRLIQTVAANNLTDAVQTFQCAIGSARSVGTLHAPLGFTVLGSIMPSTSAEEGTAAMVDIISLDDMLPSLHVTHIDLLKIDVEGAEVEVLRGATRTVQIVRRLILECHTPALLEQVTTVLHQSGFRCEIQMNINADPGVSMLYAIRSL